MILWAEDSPFVNKNYDKSIKVDQLFPKDAVIELEKKDSIYSLSINGAVQLLSDSSFVQVILTDEQGCEYVVLESSAMVSGTKSLNFDFYGEESLFMDPIIPIRLNIYIREAELRIACVNMASDFSKEQPINLKKNWTSIRKKQIEYKVKNINKYNADKGVLWRADVTDLSLLSYESKKRALGIKAGISTCGLEYYSSGIFDWGSLPNVSRSIDANNYIDEFDWRNRHGRNWITTVKNQGESGYCWAFSSVALVESMANLYYNQQLNLDLSEQDVGWYTYSGPSGYHGGSVSLALQYIRNNGVIDEATLPFIDSPNAVMPMTRPEGDECVTIPNYHCVSSYTIRQNPDTLRYLLINKGPLSSGFKAQSFSHAMLLVGFGTIFEGDTINFIEDGQFAGQYIGHENPYIGQTYWIFKNSYGVNHAQGHAGYMHFIFPDYSKISDIYYLDLPLTSMNYTGEDVSCEDVDGDGFFFWGLGPKPSGSPEWIPDEPDGDDSDYSLGPMDRYGHLLDLDIIKNDTLFVINDTTWCTRQYTYGTIVIKNNSTLTVSDTIDVYGGTNWIVESGAKLVVDGGCIRNSSIDFKPYSSCEILHNGKIIERSGNRFFMPQQTKINIEYGKIN